MEESFHTNLILCRKKEIFIKFSTKLSHKQIILKLKRTLNQILMDYK